MGQPMNETTSQEVPTGLALEKARRQVGFSTFDAAQHLGISLQALGDFESGLRTPNDELIAAMSNLYGVEPGRFASRPWVPRVPARYDAKAGVLWMGWTAIHVGGKNNEQIVCAIAATLRSLRSLTDTSPVHLRPSELPLLARLFDLADPNLENLMMQHLNISPNDALGLINEMVVYSATSA